MAELARLNWKGDEVLRLTEAEVKRRLIKACIMVANTAKQNVIVGGASGFKTSHGGFTSLRSSINYETENLIGRVGSNLKYARIQELGGVTSAHIIRPRFKKALRFGVSGVAAGPALWGIGGGYQFIFRKWVAHPGSHIPPRPYLRPALWSNEGAIRELFARPMK